MNTYFINILWGRLMGVEVNENSSAYIKRAQVKAFLLLILEGILISLLISINLSQPASIIFQRSLNITFIIPSYVMINVLLVLLQRVVIKAWLASNFKKKFLSLLPYLALSLVLSYFVCIIAFSNEINHKMDSLKNNYVQIADAKNENELQDIVMELFDLFEEKSDSINSQIRLTKIKEKFENTGPRVKLELSDSRLDKIKLFITTLKQNRTILIIYILNVFIFFGFLIFPLLLFDNIKQNQNEVKRIKKESSSEQINIFASIEHEIGNKLPALRNDLIDLREYFGSKISKDRERNLDDKIRSPLAGESIQDVDSVSDLLIRMENKLNYSISVIGNLREIICSDPSRFNSKKVNILNFIKQEGKKIVHKVQNVSIQFSGGNDIEIFLDTTQFSFVIDNFIRNAIRHGFTDNNKKHTISIEIVDAGNYVKLFIKNNGNPLPSDYSIESYIKPYSYAGKTGNSGLGGYIINNVIENHNGTIEIVKNIPDTDDYKVQFLITLPKT